MKLADLRKLSIERQYRIHFRLRNGMECVVTEHGIAKVPALGGVPDFNLETELASAHEFLLEPAQAPAGKDAPRPRTASRAELVALTDGGPSRRAAAHHDGADD
jgi:hypothetical protein